MRFGRAREFLLVEDSPADVRLTQEALSEARILNDLEVVMTGEDALEYLRDPENGYPDLVLLDLNLPGIDGRTVLREMNEDPALRVIPVVVLSTSSADRDVIEAYSLNANCFITKPVDFNQFIGVVQTIQNFWLRIVRLPPKDLLRCGHP